MTQAEIKNMLIEYATEDVQTAKEEKMMSICDTKHGVLDVEFIEGTFSIRGKEFNREGLTEAQAIEMIADSYIVEM